MTKAKFAVWTSFALAVTVASCSHDSSETSLVALQSAVQDLGVDPDGTTTVLTLGAAVAGLTEANVEADGGQTPLSVSTVGAELTVTWDERVTPSHRVRMINVEGVSAAYADVETSDDSAPTFTIEDAQQLAGLGDDVIVVQFSGPRLIEAQAEDSANWELEVGGESLSLSGSSLDLDPLTGELTIVTGPDANLHASFSLTALDLSSVADVAVSTTPVVGVANGDTTAPTLLSAEQNLAQDEFGRVIDFTFDEAMDPLFAASTANFSATSPDLALQISQPSAEVLRVTFNNPMVPGVDDVTLTGLVDAHGNALANQTTAVAAGSTVPNDFASSPELVTVSNTGGDFVSATFEQAIDPDDALDESHWQLSYDDGGGAVVIDLSSATLGYDLPTKTLTIQLADDYQNGAAFTFEGAPGDLPLDVDGETFTSTFSGSVAGDAAAPTVLLAIQRRNLDNLGRTLDVRFDEDLDEASAETLVNWGVTGLNVLTAELVSTRIVRLRVDDAAIPGDATIAISGLEDLAGNVIAAVAAQSFTSSDLRAPEGLASIANAVEGIENDTLYVAFNDRLIESEIEDPSNWSFESPLGTSIDLSNAVVDYDDDARTATLTFVAATGVDLQTDDDFVVGWSGVRDLAGNAMSSATLTGEIDAEVVLPTVVATWVETGAPNVVHVRFSEPCQQIDDLVGLTSYSVFDNADLLKGAAVSALADGDRMGVELSFGFAVLAGSDTLALRGVLDAAGNPLFALDGIGVASEDSNAPALDIGQSVLTANSGEENDTIELVFDRDLAPWGLLDDTLYTVELSGQPLDLSGATIEFDGARTVTIRLVGVDAPALEGFQLYDLAATGIASAQGVALVGSTADSIVSSGDGAPPSVPVGWARLDASSATDTLLVTFDEALDAASAEVATNYLLNGAIVPDSAELVEWRTVRCVFSGGVAVGDTLDFGGIADLALNFGAGSRAVSAADVSGPVVASAAAYSVPGAGGDYISVQFNRPVDLAQALSPNNYTLTLGSTPLDLEGATLSWSSGSFTVNLVLAAGQELEFGATLNIGADNIVDLAGLALSPAASVNVTVQGDSTAPDFASSFVNYRASSSGTVVEVLFSEAVDETFVLNALNWTVVGGPSVIGVERRSADHYRLELSSAFPVAGELELVALPDLAGNVSGAVSTTPLH
jgi:hypothetical protein